MVISGLNAGEGTSSLVESSDSTIFIGGYEKQFFAHRPRVYSGSVDSGNTGNTNQLRAGLTMGIRDSDNKWAPYDNTATDGTQNPRGFLAQSLSMTDRFGTVEDKLPPSIMVGGHAYVPSLIGLDGWARSCLAPHFRFSGDFVGRSFGAPMAGVTVLAGTGPTTLTDKSIGHLIQVTPTGNYAITLMAAQPGIYLRFLNLANFNLTVTPAVADTVITLNDIAADNVKLATSNEKLGGSFDLFTTHDATGTKWVVVPIQGTLTHDT